MKNNLINFILKEKINETGIKNSGYTWLELAKKFNIREGATNEQRRKAANDIWRKYKKKYPFNLLSGELTRDNGEDPNYGAITTCGNKYNTAQHLREKYGEPIDISTKGEGRSDGSNIYPTKCHYENHQFIYKEDKVESNKDGVYLIMGCVHIPFTNTDFMNAVLNCASTLNVKGLIFNGDFLDLNTLSFYDKGKNPLGGISLGYEYDEGNKMLDKIESVLPKDIEKHFLYGNHEDRFWRHMSTVDFAKLKGAIKNPTEALNLKNRGYKVYEDWCNDEIVLGDLTIIHGEFCGVHTAKAHLDTYKKNMLFAHTHRTQMYREGEHVAYNIGSMADFKSKAFGYASKSMKKKWSNGMAIATVVEGKTTVEQITWNKNHFVYGGNIWKA